jgi:uncharacterized membrane protein YoaK (UPF0700 family)
VAGPGGWPAAEAATLVGGACVALHVVTALAAAGDAGWVRALLLVMAAACVPCLRRLRRAPDRRAWAATGGMYAAMLAAHLLVVAPWWPGAGMAHPMTGQLTWAGLGMWGGMALAAVQVALAAVAAALLTRPAPAAEPGRPAVPGAVPAIGGRAVGDSAGQLT